MSWWTDLFKPKDYNLPSPRVTIKPEDIVKNQDGSFTIKGFPEGTYFETVQDTKSLDPFVDRPMLCAYIPFNGIADELSVGEIVSYDIELNGAVIFAAMHRIVKIDQDQYGWYCLTKGDNPASKTDKYRVRLSDIGHILGAVAWRNRSIN